MTRMKKFVGKVISAKMSKTVVVEVERHKIHPLYKKRIKFKKKFHAHNELGAKDGDKVLIAETRPISKTKKWEVKEVIK